MADTKDTRHEREARRRASHLCVRCGKNETGGPRHCKICLAKANAKTKAMWQRRKDAGLCWNCGKRPTAQNRTWCDICRVAGQRKKRKQIRLGKCNICLVNDPLGKYKSCARCRATYSRYKDRLKIQTMNAYGGPICKCCGENEIKFLAIDHIDGGGNKHRKQIGSGGNVLLADLRKRGFPGGFQVLCWNCNWGKHVNGGICPHENKIQSKSKKVGEASARFALGGSSSKRR